MHAWQCHSLTGPQDLKWEELPSPAPGPGQLRVDISAASLNFPDLLVVEGKYQFKQALPFVPGCEFAGSVSALGAGVTGWAIGDSVVCHAGHGGFATQAVVDAALCHRLPAGCDPRQAAAALTTYATSEHALMDRAALQPGETVLVLGAAGGVGTAAIELAKAHGARVIAAASSEDKCQRCLEFGADAAINYGKDDLRAELKRLGDGRGPDVIYDPVGGALTEPAFRSIGWRGRYLVVGFAAGEIPSLPLNLALLKGASVVGVFWGDYARREAAHNAAMIQRLLARIASGALSPLIDAELPLQDLKTAFERLQQRKITGKLILTSLPPRF